MAKTPDPRKQEDLVRPTDAHVTPGPARPKVNVKVKVKPRKASDPDAPGSPAAKPASAGIQPAPTPVVSAKPAPPSVPPGKLSAILGAGGNFIINNWGTTTAADDFGPLPGGSYICRLVDGELAASRAKGTPGYKLEFVVIEGEYAGRRVWHDIWLTPLALPFAKRDLAKLGITGVEHLELPLPKGIICRVQVALRRDDDGNQNNRVVTFEVLRFETQEPGE